jgi:MoaA/NifB/PqqE/SkfB family radical SAM enzyme
MTFLDTDRPKITDSWRLRNDTRNMVVYLHSLNSQSFRVLSPFESLLALLLDGTNTYAEIKTAFARIIGEGIDPHDIDLVMDGMQSIDGLIDTKGEASCSFSKGMCNLLPDTNNYLYPSRRLERPITVTIAFANTCQSDCIYCYAEREHSAQRSLKEWCVVFDEIAQNEITLVDIGGADLFTRRDAFEILSEMRKRGFFFFVSTKNHLSYEDAQKLTRLDIDDKSVPEWAWRPVQVSIDSTDDKLASFLSGSRDYFSKAEDTVKNLLKAGARPRVKSVLTAYNADVPREIVRHFVPLGVDEFHFVQYTRGMYRHDDAFFLTRQQKENLVRMDDELRAAYPDVFISIQKDVSTGGAKTLSRDAWANRPLCSGGRSKMLVKPNGDVTLCEQTPNRDPFLMGNVFEEGVIGVWNSDKISTFNYPPRAAFSGTVCFNCPDFDECHDVRGYCFRDSLCCYGSIYDAPPECPRQTKVPLRAI